MLTGRPIDAARALACGVADEVAALDALDARLDALLTDLGRAEPAALRGGTAAEGIAAMTAKRPAPWVVRPVEGAPP